MLKAPNGLFSNQNSIIKSQIISNDQIEESPNKLFGISLLGVYLSFVSCHFGASTST